MCSVCWNTLCRQLSPHYVYARSDETPESWSQARQLGTVKHWFILRRDLLLTESGFAPAVIGVQCGPTFVPWLQPSPRDAAKSILARSKLTLLPYPCTCKTGSRKEFFLCKWGSCKHSDVATKHGSTQWQGYKINWEVISFIDYKLHSCCRHVEDMNSAFIIIANWRGKYWIQPVMQSTHLFS